MLIIISQQCETERRPILSSVWNKLASVAGEGACDLEDNVDNYSSLYFLEF